MKDGLLERLLLVKNDTPAQLGLLGTTWPPGTDLKIIWQTGDGVVHDTTGGAGWPVNADAPIVAADLDGDGRSEIVAAEYGTTITKTGTAPGTDTSTTLTVLRLDGAGLTMRGRWSLEHPHFDGLKIPVRATQFIPVHVGGGADRLIALGDSRHQSEWKDNTETIAPPVFAWEIGWSDTEQKIKGMGIVAGITGGCVTATALADAAKASGVQVGLTLELDGMEEFTAITLPDGTQGVLVRGPSRPDVAVLTRHQAYLRVGWKSASGALDSATPGALGATWVLRATDRMFPVQWAQPPTPAIVVVRQDGTEIGVLQVGGDGRLLASWTARGASGGPAVAAGTG